MLRALTGLPSLMERFLPCDTGGNRWRLRHLGGEQCGHGLASTRGETVDLGASGRLLLLSGYPFGAASDLQNGSLKLGAVGSRLLGSFPLGLFQGKEMLQEFFSPPVIWDHVLMCILLDVVCLEELESSWWLEELEASWGDWSLEALEAFWIEHELEVVGDLVLEAFGRQFVSMRKTLLQNSACQCARAVFMSSQHQRGGHGSM